MTPRRTALPLLLAAAALLAPATAAEALTTATDEMAACAAIGAKRPGDANDRRMADHIADRFRAAGLSTSLESFRMPRYDVTSTTLQVVGGKDVPAETFAYGGTGTVEAGVVDVGTGRPTDYAGKDAKGKIVLVDRNEAYHRTAQLNEVVAHGGVAMLYVSGSPKNLVQIGAVRFAQDLPAPVPTITVGADDGAALRSTLKAAPATRLKLSVDAKRTDVEGRNVIGVRKGTTYPDRYIVVGGHYDSWHGGAVDNCSGIGSMLEIIEQTKDLNPAYTVVFGAWDAEEPGLVGSYDWVMRHPDLVRRTVLDENLEMTSAASYVGQSRLDYSAINLVFGTLSPAMNALVYEASARSLFAPAPTTAAGVRQISGGIIPTDLQPFYAQGVQGFSTFSSTPWYHTTEDDADKIDPASHERVTAVLTQVLRDAQAVPPEALAPAREVPTVAVSAPKTALPGAAVPVELRVTDPLGQPLTGAKVGVLVDQRDHWAVDRGVATEVGDGVYRYTIPAGKTEADRTSITATVDQAIYIGQGFGFVDQRAGGLLPAARSCLSRRVLTLHPRLAGRRGTIRSVRATASAGKARVVGRKVRLDLRGVRATSVRVRLTVRTSRGKVLRETRTYRTCARRAVPTAR